MIFLKFAFFYGGTSEIDWNLCTYGLKHISQKGNISILSREQPV
jgi:hypothetical protein